MKERKLTFNRNEDKTILEISENKKTKINDSYNKIALTLNEIKNHVDESTLEVGYSETLMYCLESYITDMLGHFNYNSVIEREKEERYARIRSLNEENRKLRSQLGAKVSNEDVREKLKNLNRIIRDWYNEEGFEYINEPSFSDYGTFSGNFSCYLSGVGNTEEEEQQKLTKLENYGFKFDKREKNLLLTVENIQLFEKFITERFPSANLGKIDSRMNRDNIAILNKITVYIDDLNDI